MKVGMGIGTNIGMDIGTNIGMRIGPKLGPTLGPKIGPTLGLEVGPTLGMKMKVGTNIGIDIGMRRGTNKGIITVVCFSLTKQNNGGQCTQREPRDTLGTRSAALGFRCARLLHPSSTVRPNGNYKDRPDFHANKFLA